MDAEAFLDFANQVAKLKMYPYFDVAHAVVCCLSIKEDMGAGRLFKLFIHFYLLNGSLKDHRSIPML